MFDELFDLNQVGGYNRQFSQKYLKEISKLKESKSLINDIETLHAKVKTQANNIASGNHKLSDLSEWFSEFANNSYVQKGMEVEGEINSKVQKILIFKK